MNFNLPQPYTAIPCTPCRPCRRPCCWPPGRTSFCSAANSWQWWQRVVSCSSDGQGEDVWGTLVVLVILSVVQLVSWSVGHFLLTGGHLCLWALSSVMAGRWSCRCGLLLACVDPKTQAWCGSKSCLSDAYGLCVIHQRLRDLKYAVLCCAVTLCCAVLHCAVLCCAALCCAVWYGSRCVCVLCVRMCVCVVGCPRVCGVLWCAVCRRLKMGVCEGVPQSVLHDHLGRADYHGDIVNQVRV